MKTERSKTYLSSPLLQIHSITEDAIYRYHSREAIYGSVSISINGKQYYFPYIDEVSIYTTERFLVVCLSQSKRIYTSLLFEPESNYKTGAIAGTNDGYLDICTTKDFPETFKGGYKDLFVLTKKNNPYVDTREFDHKGIQYASLYSEGKHIYLACCSTNTFYVHYTIVSGQWSAWLEQISNEKNIQLTSYDTLIVPPKTATSA